ncbi:MAG: hypothetical protein ABW088_12505 [Sedimenticola sp.]
MDYYETALQALALAERTEQQAKGLWLKHERAHREKLIKKAHALLNEAETSINTIIGGLEIGTRQPS